MKAVITIAIVAAIVSVMFGHSASNDKPQSVYTSQKCNDALQGLAKFPAGNANRPYYMREMDRYC
jgi:hypothetical protein